MIAVCALGTSTLSAQSARDEFVFHVYVDPLYGDDALATAQNPSRLDPARLAPLDLHRMAGLTTNQNIRGVLQHAPYSFRTLSGINGALTYVREQFYTDANGDRTVVPYANGSNTVQRVLVHCLPGLYATGSGIDPESGLPANGETFPIVIDMPRLGLQGTSALDTVIDGSGSTSDTILCFRATPNQPGTENLDETFIDGLTLRNAGFDAVRLQGYSDDVGTVPPTDLPRNINRRFVPGISNCVFSENVIGILIDRGSAVSMGVLQFNSHAPRIVNNTFGNNIIGLWSGDLRDLPGSAQLDMHDPVVVNNLFEVRVGGPRFFPLVGFLFLGSAFIGLSEDDLRIASIDGVPFGPGAEPDSNAWPVSRGNLLPVFPTSFPITIPIPATPPGSSPGGGLPSPRVDLDSFTASRFGAGGLQSGVCVTDPLPATSGGRRAVLFVRDALDETTGQSDYSPHDYRLAPTIRATFLDSSLARQVGEFQNPLINAGAIGDVVSGSGILMKNGELLPRWGTGWPSFINDPAVDLFDPADPSYPAVVQPENDSVLNAEEGPTCGWDQDLEGFGNPRIFAPERFVNGSPAPLGVGTIDIGADEVGTLIVAGFRNGTRAFDSAHTPNTSTSTARLTPYFLGLPNSSDVRPLRTTNVGGVATGASFPFLPWYEHVQNPTDVTTGNYTDGSPVLAANPPFRQEKADSSLVTPSDIRLLPFMRNLVCDFAPAPALDLVGFWSQLMHDAEPGAVFPRMLVDYYGSNPSYDRRVDPLSSLPLLSELVDNPALFHNRRGVNHDAIHVDVSTGSPAFTQTFVGRAHLNPPGTFLPVQQAVGTPMSPNPALNPANSIFAGQFLVGQFGGRVPVGIGVFGTGPRFGPFSGCSDCTVGISFNELGVTAPGSSSGPPLGCPGTILPINTGDPSRPEPGVARRVNLQAEFTGAVANLACTGVPGPTLADQLQPTNLQTLLMIPTPCPGQPPGGEGASGETPDLTEGCEAVENSGNS